MTTQEKTDRLAQIDAMFETAEGWGSWMVSCSNEREFLVKALASEGVQAEHKYQARTAGGGAVS